MNKTLSPEITKTRIRSVGPAVDLFCQSLLFKKLALLKTGRLVIEDKKNIRVFGEANPSSGLEARIIVNQSDFYSRATMGGSIGAGESYADGSWECDNLAGLIQIFIANRDVLNNLDSGLGVLLQPLERMIHKARRNSIKGSKENITAHYDLGNDFFGLFLDDSMTYSCGIFEKEKSTLFEASIEKYDRICRKLDIKPSDHVLEIGTGWGGFAIHAAKKYGCRVTTTTISQAQLNMARERVKKEGLENRIELLFEDYRSLTGTYDKLVSIEMVEAVGLDHLDAFFKVCGDRLKPSGSMLMQVIIIQDQFYQQAKKSVDFIQKHIFPGSGIPSISSLVTASARSSDMRLFHQEDFTSHYVKTLQAWTSRLKKNKAEFLALGYPERLYRLWEFYFAYCEGGFQEKSIGLVQMIFTKPKTHQRSIVGII